MSEEKNIINVHVKYVKELFKNIKIDLNTINFELFQAQIFSLTNVPIDNQKLLIKGKRIKNTDDLLKLIKNNQKIMVMGNKNILKSTKKIKFIEDMNEEEKSQYLAQNSINNNEIKSGLDNLGNTCYMNSTLQCLRNINEFKTRSIKYAEDSEKKNNISTSNNLLYKSLGLLYKDMDKTIKPVTPFLFTNTMRHEIPQFNQRDDHGHYMQQDAEEFIINLLNKTEDSDSTELFNGEFIQYDENIEHTDCGEQVQIKSNIKFKKLSCYITSDINYLSQGIKLGLESQVTKFSSLLNKNCLYKKSLKIIKLPKYLIIHYQRFGWKNISQQSTPNLLQQQQEQASGVKTKILRKVVYPEMLDISEYCDEKLSNILKASQMKLKQEENKKLKLGKYATPSKKDPKTTRVEKPEEKVYNQVKIGELPSSIDDIIELPNDLITSGNYLLDSVITHQGRTGDSGHYIGWTRQKDDNWLKFDDAVVTHVKTEDILRLAGGGDWHMSYINIYKRIDNLKDKKWDV